MVLRCVLVDWSSLYGRHSIKQTQGVNAEIILLWNPAPQFLSIISCCFKPCLNPEEGWRWLTRDLELNAVTFCFRIAASGFLVFKRCSCFLSRLERWSAGLLLLRELQLPEEAKIRRRLLVAERPSSMSAEQRLGAACHVGNLRRE